MDADGTYLLEVDNIDGSFKAIIKVVSGRYQDSKFWGNKGLYASCNKVTSFGAPIEQIYSLYEGKAKLTKLDMLGKLLYE